MTVLPGRPAGWSTDAAHEVVRPFRDAGVIGRFEVFLIAAVCRTAPVTPSDNALLALALTARATLLGHVCLDLDDVRAQVLDPRDDPGAGAPLALPEPDAWLEELARSSIVATEASIAPDPTHLGPVLPLVLAGRRLYLQRYWRFEVDVADQLASRSTAVGSPKVVVPSDDLIDAALDAVFGTEGSDADGPDLQRVAAFRALSCPVTIIAGGPGTGKTHTVAGILAAEHRLATERGEVFRPALAAPTGKAAARMREAVYERVGSLQHQGRITATGAAELVDLEPVTIHGLLGRRTRTAFRHDRSNPLTNELVIIDETSMVSLPLLARLLDALRPTARLVLVGDPFQLSSIEAGTVMADLVGPLAGTPGDGTEPLRGRVTVLTRGHRYRTDSSMADLAGAIRTGDADAAIALLGSGDPAVHWVRPGDGVGLTALRAQVTTAARGVVQAALTGNGTEALAAAGRIKVLAATRRGPNGLVEWSDLISVGVEDVIPPGQRMGWPRVGTPVMVTGNDPVNRLANGDVGVVIEDDGRWVVIDGSDQPRRLAPARLGDWEPWWAMTIHKSQGSEFPHAVVALPPSDSPILTRELLYTSVTRGKPEVTVVGSEEVIRLAISRPVTRASGLGPRLWPGT